MPGKKVAMFGSRDLSFARERPSRAAAYSRRKPCMTDRRKSKTLSTAKNVEIIMIQGRRTAFHQQISQTTKKSSGTTSTAFCMPDDCLRLARPPSEGPHQELSFSPMNKDQVWCQEPALGALRGEALSLLQAV
eukprot:CAMPEP_0180668838 /NCGR_PEP_ID=MMETSP1037_2-20121125/63149_1 /TAXON_ID=632150 /ORGANISM="Azadinium spinosum, Strain 3D9" /LENGTH=132 /DNA_ID=CAMNT_0022697615 /DNA_START=274 /DNA_END=668 /DNA_ORIENTATION=+